MAKNRNKFPQLFQLTLQEITIVNINELQCMLGRASNLLCPKTKSLFISSVYRPPDFNIENFTEKLNKDSSKIQENAEVILLGDFNVDYQQRSTAKSRLQTLARFHLNSSSRRQLG